ncbi:unnamed protein product [Adineta steineri]|uniref:Uncharacterized protein n=1 Tax=Adineta steineri TaxID=433720 RepID=A0A819TNJ7_9BILA|nr:unnamed protein product [Adineta steineri]CAF4082333.1 unnamed protein product [Adineta steineri]
MTEVKQHINEIQDIECPVDEEDSDDGTPVMDIKDLPAVNRWIAKYPEVTWLNFPPFTPSGDINDATFLLPADVAKDPRKVLRVWLNSYQNFVCGGFGNVTHEKTRNRSSTVTKSDHALKIKESLNKQDESILYYMKLIERHWSFNTGIAKGATVWATIDGFIGAGLKSIAEQDRRQLLDSNLNIMKKRRQKLSAYFHAKPDTFCIFAQLMRKNILDFQETCKKAYVRAIQK